MDLNFRDKRKIGWLIHEEHLIVTFESGFVLEVNAMRNNYFRAFLNDYICRESCTNCEFVYDRRTGDLTIGDYWGIQDRIPEMFDDKGASCVLIQSEKGKALWEQIAGQFEIRESTLEDVFRANHKKPSPRHSIRDEIFEQLDETASIDQLLEEYNDLKKTVS